MSCAKVSRDEAREYIQLLLRSQYRLSWVGTMTIGIKWQPSDLLLTSLVSLPGGDLLWSRAVAKESNPPKATGADTEGYFNH